MIYRGTWDLVLRQRWGLERKAALEKAAQTPIPTVLAALTILSTKAHAVKLFK